MEGEFICPVGFHLPSSTVALYASPEVKGQLGEDKTPTKRDGRWPMESEKAHKVCV